MVQLTNDYSFLIINMCDYLQECATSVSLAGLEARLINTSVK